MAERNYTQLADLHTRFAESRGLRILAFPCNQFGKQEPGSAEEIKQFAASHGANFDLFSKLEVNGAGAHPLYKFLKSRLKGSLGSFVKWNYEKFVCDRDGVPVKRFLPTTAPVDIIPELQTLWSSHSNGPS